MTETDVLTWVRGSGLQIAVAVFVLGLTYRVLQNLLIGTPAQLAEARGSRWGPGLKTVWHRSFFHPGMTYRGYFTLIAGYTFHLGFLITLFFLAQHITLFRSLLGFGWPALPPLVIDITAVLGIAALIAVLVHRLMDPVLRHLSDFQDYFTWALTILPLVTGFLLMHKTGLPYKTVLAAHLLSAELLLVCIPFTKLSHMVTLFISRWYNGALAGYRGVQS